MPRTHREYQSSFRIISASEIGMRDFKIESAPCPAPMANHAKTLFDLTARGGRLQASGKACGDA
jgi:hypothetical protein